MQISFTEPLERAFEHMKAMLFSPFDLGKWLVVGFACWLAQLTQGGGSGSFPSWTADLGDDADAATLTAWGLPEALREQPWLLGCGAAAALLAALLLLLIPLLIWLSSRGHFVFLDNVVRDRAEIREPWNRFATEGNSLFLWRLGFLFAALLLVPLAAAPLLGVLFFLQNRGSFALGEVAAVTASVTPIAATVAAVIYTHLFLLHFVVPIMRRERLTTNAAWARFLPLLRDHFGAFLIYGLFILALWIGVSFTVVLVVVLTCCVAAIPLIIPYLGTVALLPVYVAFRAYSVEFLGQLMPSIALARPEIPAPGRPSESPGTVS